MSIKKNIGANKFKIMIAGLTLLCPPYLYADPIIGSVNGKITPGSTVEIIGSGFGTKASAQPFMWDDFENGALGESPSNHGWTKYGQQTPVYTNINSYSGSQSILRKTNFDSDDFNSVGMKGLNSLQFYYSGWFYWEVASGNIQGGSVVKILRVNSSPAGDFYSGSTSSPSLWITQMPESNVGGWTVAGFLNDNSDLWDQQDITELTAGSWHRIEAFITLSNPAGNNNGNVDIWINGTPSYHKTGITRTTNEAGKMLDNFLLPAMIDRGGQVMHYFVDDVHADTTPQRIEICTSPTWKDCTTNKAIQTVTTWSDNKISFELDMETLPTDEGKLYAYVVDKNNVANSNGYDLLVNRPKPPSSIDVQKIN